MPNQTERLLNDAADHIAATLEQPSDPRAWAQILAYCPDDLIAARKSSVRSPIKRIICYLRGHQWELLPYDDGPRGWSYENHKCLRCEASMRELVASRQG